MLRTIGKTVVPEVNTCKREGSALSLVNGFSKIKFNWKLKLPLNSYEPPSGIIGIQGINTITFRTLG